MTLTLAAAGVVSCATGLAFAWVAFTVARRHVSPENRLGHRAHATWWAGLGAYLVLQGALTILAGFGALTRDLYAASRILAIPLLCASVWGISTYLIALYRGNTRAAMVLAVVYALISALFFWATFGQGELQLRTERWLVTLDDSSPAYRIVYLFVGLPPILASIAYLALLPRIQDPVQRRRVKLVGGAILAYVGAGLAARLAASDAVIFITLTFLGLGAAAATLLAHHPRPDQEPRSAPEGAP